ncbi:MAG: Gfo/Idh/MocA family oxidoreductase [Alphaproteobacteria bacterium]|nr:Gfo/Idh/MocA family oxidoreductase [Alphaproteobacteria bacterium]
MAIRTALIGRGLGGSVFHAPLVRACAGLELTRWVGAADAQAAATAPDVELVVIATPNAFHFPLARAALEAGKHVVVDKPFTVTLSEADGLIALAAARKRVLTVFHNRRWDGDFLTVRKLLPRLGTVRLFEAHWDRFRPAIKPGWREVPAEGAGLLADLGPHLVDQALLLLGTPEALSAELLAQRPEARVDDYFELRLHYGTTRAVLGASTLVAAPRPRFAVHGDGGSFVKHGLDPQEAALKAGADPRDAGLDPMTGTLTLADGACEPVPGEPGNYLAFYEAVGAAVRGEGPVPVDPADAREGLRILELARTSARAGRVVPV